ncbi:MAG: NAD-dependent epimerase/dehydratase family protein [Pseudomonadota bacterium]
MRCLVVGGTGFLGGAITDALVEHGHDVAILSRGSTSRPTRSSVEAICTDRFGDLGSLVSERFDWVFDTCAFSPDAVETLLSAVGENIERYVLISSISAYGEFLKPALCEKEDVPEASMHDLEVASNVPPDKRASAFAYGSSYGPLKRSCELKASRMLADRATSLRVGLLVGAGDYTDRLTWWVRRIDQARGERTRVPAPAPPQRPVQLIDVRDVAEFAIRSTTENLPGIWNVTGKTVAISEVLDAVIKVCGSNAELVWVDEDAIQSANVVPWVDMPMMAPSSPTFRYFLEVSTGKACSKGLKCRPIEETLKPLLDWDRSRRETKLKVGLTTKQELLLLS